MTAPEFISHRIEATLQGYGTQWARDARGHPTRRLSRRSRNRRRGGDCLRAALPLLRRHLCHHLLLVQKDARRDHAVQPATGQERRQGEVLPDAMVRAAAVLPIVRANLLGSRTGAHLHRSKGSTTRPTQPRGGLRRPASLPGDCLPEKDTEPARQRQSKG